MSKILSDIYTARDELAAASKLWHKEKQKLGELTPWHWAYIVSDQRKLVELSEKIMQEKIANLLKKEEEIDYKLLIGKEEIHIERHFFK